MTQQTTSAGLFRPVGTAGFGEQRQRPRAFDQQPWKPRQRLRPASPRGGRTASPSGRPPRGGCSHGSLGSNDLSVALVDPETGSCRDGLHPDRANENRGGELVLSYLLSLAEIRQLARSNIERAQPAAASRRGRLKSVHLSQESPPTSRGHLAATHFPESAGAVSSARSGARHRAPVQAGDRTPRSQPDRQDTRQSYRRPGSGPRCRSRRQPARRCPGEFPGPASQPAGDIRGARRRHGRGAGSITAASPRCSAS